MDFNIYKNKKVFITGHTGFKGAWLSLWLLEKGAQVYGYALEPNTEPSLFDILQLNKKLNHTIGDIRHFDDLKKALTLAKPDIVFHLAAQPIVRLSYQEPLQTYQTNILGTANVLEICRSIPSISAIINITTDKCYKNLESDIAYKETDPLGGYDPYSASKAASEIVTASYRDSFFNIAEFGKTHNTLLASARAGNVIGGGDYAKDRIIPDFIRAMRANKNILLRNPKSIRPWQFMLEPLSGYLTLGKSLLEKNANCADAYNFGPYLDNAITVEEVIKKSISVFGKGGIDIDKSIQPHEANLLKLNIDKAEKELSWRPKYSATQAIEKTIAWYKDYYNGAGNMADFSLGQIKDYEK